VKTTTTSRWFAALGERNLDLSSYAPLARDASRCEVVHRRAGLGFCRSVRRDRRSLRYLESRAADSDRRPKERTLRRAERRTVLKFPGNGKDGLELSPDGFWRHRSCDEAPGFVCEVE